MGVRRGDLVTVAFQGDYGKPRPALVVQSDLFSEHPSITLLPLTSELRDAPLFRVRISPDDVNHLREPSEVMVDKAQTISRSKVGEAFGRLDAETMVQVERALALFLGLA